MELSIEKIPITKTNLALLTINIGIKSTTERTYLGSPSDSRVK